MRRTASLALLALLALARGAAADGEDDADRRRVGAELVPSRTEAYEGETVGVTLRVRWDRAWFEAHGVPLFRRELDVPFQVEAPALAALPGRPLPIEAVPDAARRTIALDGNAADASAAPDVELGGTAFGALEVHRRFRAAGVGDHELAAPAVRYAFASRFTTDAIGLRVAVDRQEARTAGTGATIRVLAVPAEGRPPGYGGAVGSYRASATVEPRSLGVGEPLRVTVRVEGEGNLEDLATPPFAPPGFHAFGSRATHERGASTYVYDLAPLDASVREVPSFVLPVFEPRPHPAFRTLATAPVPIEVRPPPGAPPRAPDAAAPPGSPWLLLGLVAVLVATGLGLGLWLRRRRPGDADADAARRAATRARLADAVARSAPDVAGAFRDALLAHGIDPASPEPARLLARLSANRYGGEAPTREDLAATLRILDGPSAR